MKSTYIRKPNHKCSICNSEVYKRPCSLKKTNGVVFCSKKCYGTTLRKEIPCKICDKLILRGKNSATCSSECALLYKEYLKRENKWGRYKGAKIEELKSYRTICFRFYEEKCSVCPFDKVIEVHHLDENRENNEIKNLIPLCPNHHRMIHVPEYKQEILLKVLEVQALTLTKELLD